MEMIKEIIGTLIAVAIAILAFALFILGTPEQSSAEADLCRTMEVR